MVDGRIGPSTIPSSVLVRLSGRERRPHPAAVACPPMAHDRRFRFGIQLATATSGADWAAQARKAEDLGSSTLFLPDHFGEQLAPVPALMAAAAATPGLKVGALGLHNRPEERREGKETVSRGRRGGA